MRFLIFLFAALAGVAAALSVSETSTNIDISNSRLSVSFLKSLGSILNITLDGQDLLGPRNGSIGVGPYLGILPSIVPIP